MAVCGAFSLSIAREDPFTPVVVPKDSIRPYYGETSVFDSAQIEFPSSARLIKKIEVTFQNIDGSIQTRSVAARGRIDWRMPLLISQVLNKNQITQKNIDKTPQPSPKPKKTMVKAVDIPLDNAESKETITRESEDSAREMRISGDSLRDSRDLRDSPRTNAQDLQDSPRNDSPKNAQNSPRNDSPKIAQTKDSAPQVRIISKPREINTDSAKNIAKSTSRTNKFTPYLVNGNSIFISYGGGLKRHYIMQNPYRIVMDFEINKKYYKKNSYTINQPYFKRLRYGLHTHFLRIVLELDGSYVYTLQKRTDGVKIDVQ